MLPNVPTLSTEGNLLHVLHMLVSAKYTLAVRKHHRDPSMVHTKTTLPEAAIMRVRARNAING